MEVFKIIVTGGADIDRLNFISIICDQKVANNHHLLDNQRSASHTSGARSLYPQTTPVNFGRLTLNSSQVVYFLGIADKIIDKTRDVLFNQADAYVLLVDAGEPQKLRHSRRLLNTLSLKANTSVIVAITNLDRQQAWQINDISLALGLKNLLNSPSTIELDSHNPSSVAHCLITLLENTKVLNLVST